jgi:hypothetical protein
MCFTEIVYSRDGIGEVGYTIVANSLTEAMKNPDGFGIRIDDEVFKTLDRWELVKKIVREREKIERAKLVHLHYRSATSGAVNHDNIHLWEIGGYIASHNGTAFRYNYKDNNKTDSYNFLKSIEDLIIREDLKGIADRLDETWGVFLLSKKDKILLAAVDKALKIYLFDDVLVFSSDTVNLAPEVHITCETIQKKLFGWTFAREKKMRLKLKMPKETLKTTEEDFVSLLDLETGTRLTEKVSKKRSYVSPSYYWKYRPYYRPWSE